MNEMPKAKSNTPEILDPFRYNIAIVGMGAAGASLFGSLLDRLVELQLSDNVAILLVDARPEKEFGRGIAWSSIQYEGFRANMRLHTIGLKRRLLEKILAAAGHSENTDPKDLPDDFLFHQRQRIGEALHEEYRLQCSRAQEYGIPVQAVSGTVEDISKHNSGWILHVQNGEQLFAHSVTLALGNVPNYPMNELRGKSGYLHNPWDWEQYRTIPEGSRVAVIGLGPTAVDAIVILQKMGFKKIGAYSRTGRMQYPRPHNTSHDLVFLDQSRLEDLIEIRKEQGKPGLPYDTLQSLLTMEFQEAGACEEFSKARKNNKLAPKESLYAGLQDADKYPKWYSIMKALDPITPFLWNSLDSTAREEYFNELRYDHTNLSYGMASVWARRICEYISSHELTVDAGFQKVSAVGDKFLVTYLPKTEGAELTTKEYDFVINCTGIGSRIEDTNSPLLKSLHAKKWVMPHNDGGIRVDFHTGHILGAADKPIGEMYSLVGSLTFGTHLLTHCLWQVWQSSERTAQSIVRSIAASAPRVD
jgi:uncharacterized NAD(P)/FAD-binding protein YdhS